MLKQFIWTPIYLRQKKRHSPNPGMVVVHWKFAMFFFRVRQSQVVCFAAPYPESMRYLFPLTDNNIGLEL